MVVRGLNFMSDKKKIDCAPPIYKLMHADIFRTAKDQERAAHFAAHPLSWASLRWERKQARDAAAAAAAAPAAAAVVEAPAAAASAAADADGLAASMGAVEVSASAAAPLPAAVASPSNCPTPANSPAANGSAGTSPQPQASNAGLNAATAGMMSDPLAPLIVINFLIPGSSGTSMNLVLYFARRIKPAEQLRKHKEHKEAQHQKAHHHGEGHGAHSHPPPLTKADSAKRGHHGSSHKLHTGTPFSTSPFGQPTGPAAAAAGFSHPVPNRDAACYYASEFESDDFPHDIERIAAFDSLLLKFLNGTDEFRDGRLKIVPRVAEGSWVVKKSIGRVPAILGKKVSAHERESIPSMRAMHRFAMDPVRQNAHSPLCVLVCSVLSSVLSLSLLSGEAILLSQRGA